MNTIQPRNDSIFWATVDLLFSFVGVSIALYPVIWIGNALLEFPLADTMVRILVGVLAFGGAYPFVTGDWSLGKLGEFTFAFAGSTVFVGLLLAFGIAALDLQFAGENPAPQAAMFTLSYLLSFIVVKRRHR